MKSDIFLTKVLKNIFENYYFPGIPVGNFSEILYFQAILPCVIVHSASSSFSAECCSIFNVASKLASRFVDLPVLVFSTIVSHAYTRTFYELVAAAPLRTYPLSHKRGSGIFSQEKQSSTELTK